MPETARPPAPAGPVMYAVPAWVAVYGAAVTIGAAVLLLWASPAAGIVVLLTTAAVALVGLGATPTTVRERTGVLAELNHHLATHPPAPAPAVPLPAEPDRGPLVSSEAIGRVLGRHGLPYRGKSLYTTELRTLGDHYWQQGTEAGQQAAAAIDGLIERAEQARTNRRAAEAMRREQGAQA